MVQENLEALDRVQTDLNDVNEKASAEIIQIEKKYNELRKPFFEKRQKCIETIPNFWLTVVRRSNISYRVVANLVHHPPCHTRHSGRKRGRGVSLLYQLSSCKFPAHSEFLLALG